MPIQLTPAEREKFAAWLEQEARDICANLSTYSERGQAEILARSLTNTARYARLSVRQSTEGGEG